MAVEKSKRGSDPRQGSLLWPIILIGVGVIWLLGNLGILTGANLAALLQLWPLFLVVIGLDMLIRQDHPGLRPLLGLGAVVVLVGAALLGPSLGLGSDQVETWQKDIPLEGAESADISIDGSSALIQVGALTDSPNLAQMQIVDSGQIEMDYQPGPTASIQLSRHSPSAFGFLATTGDSARRWNIDLSDRIPLNLKLDLASGNSQLDLHQLQLDELTLDGGSGEVALQLPGGPYHITSDHGSGHWIVDLPRQSAFQWEIADLGSGNLEIHVPAQVGIRIDIQDSGSGRLDFPADWSQLSGDDKTGEWESSGYSNADYHAAITIRDRGSGDIIIREQG